MRGAILRYGQVKLAHDVNRSAVHKRIGGAGTDSKSSLSRAVSAMGWGQRGCEARGVQKIRGGVNVRTWQMGVLKNSTDFSR